MDPIKSRFLELLDIINQASPPNWEGFHSPGFGVQIPQIIAIRGDHGDYIKWRDSVAILATRNTVPNFIEAAMVLLEYVQDHSLPENFQMSFTDAKKTLEEVSAIIARDLDSPFKPHRTLAKDGMGWNAALEEAAQLLESQITPNDAEIGDPESQVIWRTLGTAATQIRGLKK